MVLPGTGLALRTYLPPQMSGLPIADVLSTSAELGERDPPPYHGKRQVRATVT